MATRCWYVAVAVTPARYRGDLSYSRNLCYKTATFEEIGRAQGFRVLLTRFRRFADEACQKSSKNCPDLGGALLEDRSSRNRVLWPFASETS